MSRTILFLLVGAVAALAQNPCEALKSQAKSDFTINKAELVPAGPFTAPPQPAQPAPGVSNPPAAAAQAGRGGRGGAPAAPAGPSLPSFCRIAGVLIPSSDSHIEVEIWLPAEGWNGKYEAVGNGGWAGTITYNAMGDALREGYATSSVDTGHVSGDPTFGVNHPEKVVDFAYRSVHEMVVKSKALITAYYGKAPKYSYWNGCSTGGRQGLMSAQKYPEDFDGIAAGAPANYQTHLHSWDMNIATYVRKDPANAIPNTKLATLNKAVLAACDGIDGVKDSLIQDPHKCKFDPITLLCKGADSSDCLTQAQVDSARKIYSPATLKDGKMVYPGMPRGGETGWAFATANGAPQQVSQGSFIVSKNEAQWDWKTFDLDKDVAIVDEKIGYINAINPDLSAFKKRGGKLLQYHGWNDQAISAENSINYHDSVLAKMGAKQEDWYRLFMVPGMQHCRGGPGPNQFNFMAALERWREAGQAPDSMTAYHVTGANVDMSRPLCPYPQVAVYKGTGSTNDAASFSCKAP